MLKTFIRYCWFFMFSLFLCLGTPATTSAEETYRITETELTRLETNLAMLHKQRQQLQREFLQLKIQQEKLDKQVTLLENQLAISKASSQTLETQLKTVNESFKEFAKEEKSKRLLAKRQRNLYFVLFTGCVTALVVKATG